MNIVIQDTGGAHHWQHLGWAKVFTYCGHNVLLWNPAEKPALDLFNEIQVDVFLGQAYNLTRPLIKALAKTPDCRVALKAGDWGPMNLSWDHQKYPVLLASEEEKDLVGQVMDNNGINFLHIHYHPKWIGATHGCWTTEFGLPVHSSMNAADIFEYTNGIFMPEIASDVAFVGGRWGYKSITLDAYLLKLCNPNLNLNVKIFGNTGWGVPQYCGTIPDALVKHVFSSATICPSISELHSQDFGHDIIERPFKLLSNKSFCISDKVEGLEMLFPDGIVYADNPKDFVEKVFHYLNHPDERLPFIESGYEAVMKSHTYFDRAASFFENLGFTKEAEDVIIMKNKALSEVNK